jgi:hypothetical protein
LTRHTQRNPLEHPHAGRALGLGATTIRRVWRSNGLTPHLSRTFKLSRDPRFEDKLLDVVGLYMNPPEHALVLSCDEKSQIQGASSEGWRVQQETDLPGQESEAP